MADNQRAVLPARHHRPLLLLLRATLALSPVLRVTLHTHHSINSTRLQHGECDASDDAGPLCTGKGRNAAGVQKLVYDTKASLICVCYIPVVVCCCCSSGGDTRRWWQSSGARAVIMHKLQAGSVLTLETQSQANHHHHHHHRLHSSRAAG